MPVADDRLARRIERRVLRFIQGEGLLRGGECVLLAVSGGVDSLTLLGVTARLAPLLDVRLRTAYVDHRIRAEEEIAADIAAVSGVAARLGVPFAAVRVEEPPAARGRSPEEAARLARYRALAAEAARSGAAVVATGHTRSDQAETVLLRLLRGSGLRGLSAMAPRAPWPDPAGGAHLSLIRPLLCLSREETAAYCRALALQPRHDRENENRRYLRNRLRQDVMPILRGLNPAVEPALARLAAEARELRAAQDGDADAGAPAAWDGQQVVLDKGALRGLAPAARTAALRAALAQTSPGRAAPARAHLEALERLVRLDRAAEAHLPRGLRAWTEGARLLIGRRPAPPPALPELRVPVPGTLRLPGWLVRAAPAEGEAASPRGWAVVLAAATVEGLTVGPRRPGDRIDFGGGHQRLQDLLVNEKVPRAERDRLPVFRTARGVVWVAGVRAAVWALAAPGEAAVRVSVERLPGMEPAPARARAACL